MSLRIAFMGSPEFAVPTLRRLIADGHDIACVYSQPPRPAGRGQALRRTPVHEAADEAGIEVRTPLNFKAAEDRDAFAALDLDAAVVVAYGLLLPKAILDAPRLGCYNLHGSLLPRWRGAAPIHRAIMAGDAETGVQVMKMDVGLDTGPVLMTARTPISGDDTLLSVHDRLADLGAGLMSRALVDLEAGAAQPQPQTDEGVTYASKITPDEARIDWSKPAHAVSAHIRGLSPFPGAWFECDAGKGMVRVKALQVRTEPTSSSGAPGELLDDALLVACGEGAVRLLRLQRAGKGPMDAPDFLRGAMLSKGVRLS
ncbi:MAG: methionyl-tRNA formyltransferase [Hyphomonadaceae bacterium]